MDREDQIRIELSPLSLEPGKPPPDDRFLGIQAHLRIVLQGREWFSEPMFPIVELAAAVSSWLKRGGELNFETMEASESPFLQIRPTGEVCTLYAAWQKFEMGDSLSLLAVRGEMARFVSEVVRLAKEQLQLDVSDLVAISAG